MRKGFSVIFIVLGFGFVIWSCSRWYSDGMPTDNLWPYKNTIGTNIIHMAYIGLALLSYGAFDYWLQLQSKE